MFGCGFERGRHDQVAGRCADEHAPVDIFLSAHRRTSGRDAVYVDRRGSCAQVAVVNVEDGGPVAAHNGVRDNHIRDLGRDELGGGDACTPINAFEDP